MEKPRYNVHLRTSGDIAVGKTSLMVRWFQDTFSSVELVTIGGDMHSKIVDVGDVKVKVEMIDTGGQEKFRQITSSFYRKTHGLMLVYDVCSRASFDAIRTSWFKEAERYMSGDIKVMMLVGNKEDKVAERAVSTEEGKQLAADLGIDHFIETSCKESVNVEEAFGLMIGSVVEKMEAKQGSGPGAVSTQNTLSIGEEPAKKKKGCVLW